MKVLQYEDIMPVTRGEPAWVLLRGGFVQTAPVLDITYPDGWNPVFSTREAKYRPAARFRHAYPNNHQVRPDA